LRPKNYIEDHGIFQLTQQVPFWFMEIVEEYAKKHSSIVTAITEIARF